MAALVPGTRVEYRLSIQKAAWLRSRPRCFAHGRDSLADGRESCRTEANVMSNFDDYYQK